MLNPCIVQYPFCTSCNTGVVQLQITYKNVKTKKLHISYIHVMKRDKSRESARNDQKALKVFTSFH